MDSNINLKFIKKIKKKVILNNETLKSFDNLEYLYPEITDPNFNLKIASKKQFNDTKFDGKIKDVTKFAEIFCNMSFNLANHQLFVRNFMSIYTPYNSLLLFHGLGTGKTCSSIGIAEEMRDYMKQVGIRKKIIYIASPNVQDEIKKQLFNSNKLELVNGNWNLRDCTGNKFIKEINPTNLKGMNKQKVIAEIQSIINYSYDFYGYIEFANLINKLTSIKDSENPKLEESNILKLKKNYSDTLIIIDEVHNIRINDENKDKKLVNELFKLIKYTSNLRFLLLSATPLYNSYKEIILLLSLMNVNDKKDEIKEKDIFDKDGNLLVNEEGEEIGKNILMQKATGYISFVKGDNPYSFPYRVWPSQFDPKQEFNLEYYPDTQLNGNKISAPIEFLSLYKSNLGEIQKLGYEIIVNNEKKREEFIEVVSESKNSDTLGYTELQKPIQALNIIYPSDELFSDSKIDINELVSTQGLNNIMKYTKSYNPPSYTNFEYKDTEKFGRIFAPSLIGKYSGKIKEICNNILNSQGIILIYTQYIDSGIIPIALALEEMGITRYGNTSSLFKTPPVENLDLKTYTNTNQVGSIPAKYTIISGDSRITPKNNKLIDKDILVSKENINGEKIKIILITKTGSEGIDFKNIRQIHILEPWYNLSRIEQIIGRGVRNCSHKDLPFAKRNVQLFLYCTELSNPDEEAADLYLYRLAEKKSKKIGKITRILKQVSIDCLLNKEQFNFIDTNFQQKVILNLSNGKDINYQIGDKPYSAQCDYMDKCFYKCEPNDEIYDINDLSINKFFIDSNNSEIILRIKQLFKEKHYYDTQELINSINIIKEFPLIHIYSALSEFIDNKEILLDKYNRPGFLINIDNYYLYQPEGINYNNNISLYDRNNPFSIKIKKINYNIPDEIPIISESKEKKIVLESTKDDKSKINGKNILNEMNEKYEISTSSQLIVRGEKKDWYKSCSKILLILINEYGYDREILYNDLLISHLIEKNNFENTINILNYLYFSELNQFEQLIKQYFDNLLLVYNKLQGLLILNENNVELLILNNDKKEWEKAKPQDKKDFNALIRDKKINESDLNNIIGYMTTAKEGGYVIFKVKEQSKARNKGARCDQAQRNYNILLINNILNEKNKYTIENLKEQKIDNNQLCILQEFILRYKNYEKENEKIWFLSPTQAIQLGV